MNLVDDDAMVNSKGNKKIFMACIIGLVILFVIIIVLFSIANSLKDKQTNLVIDGQKMNVSNYLISKNFNELPAEQVNQNIENKEEKIFYIAIEDLVKAMPGNNYSYKSGSRDVEDNNKCYITNTYESTYFNVNSNIIWKLLEDTKEVEFYTLDYPVIKENGKIYMPIDAVEIAANVTCTKVKGTFQITSIGNTEGKYNKEESKTFIPDSSIVWETTYTNKKMLKYGLVIVKDSEEHLGVGKVKLQNTQSGKSNVSKVVIDSVIDSKYTSISYDEKFSQLTVENEAGKGINKISMDENGNFNVKTIIAPQYENIKQIDEDLFIISKTDVVKVNEKETKITKYGLINSNGKSVLPVEYEKIGIDVTNFANNNLTDAFLIDNQYIPVKKDGKWGLVDKNGNITLPIEYDSFGCTDVNSSSNVFIIPELDSVVVKKDKGYGIITYTGEVIIKNVMSKVYIDTTSEQEEYMFIYNGTSFKVIEYVEKYSGVSPKTEKTTENKEENNTENKTETKTEHNTENKTETKSENKTENKVETKTEKKSEDETEDQIEVKTENKTEFKKEDKED